MPVRRGEIYWIEFDPVKGSEQGGLRPGLVVQNDIGNATSSTTVVAALMRRLSPRNYPFLVVVTADRSGLNDDGVVNCAQLVTIQQSGPESRLRAPRGESDVRPIARLDGPSMAAVDDALRYNLGLR